MTVPSSRRGSSRAARSASALLLAILAAASPAAAQQTQELPAIPAELEAVRAALDKYRDWMVAVRDGYLSTVGCITYPAEGGAGRVPYQAGGMGVHFLNAASVGPEPDPVRPQILIYEPSGDGLRLAAAEWFVPLATGVTGPPSLFGRGFDGPMEGHLPLMPGTLHHYDLHVWLWKENPAGLFSPTNPALRCPLTGTTIPEEAPRIVAHP